MARHDRADLKASSFRCKQYFFLHDSTISVKRVGVFEGHRYHPHVSSLLHVHHEHREIGSINECAIPRTHECPRHMFGGRRDAIGDHHVVGLHQSGLYDELVEEAG